MVDILTMLRPLTAKRLDGLEELAARLAAGTAVPPDEIKVVVDRCRCNADDLQAAVDRHARVADLRRTVADGVAGRRRLAAIQAELRPLAEAREAANRAEDDAIRRHYDELFRLQQLIGDADRAAGELLAPKNLPAADAEKLTAALARENEASEAFTAATSELADRRRRLRLGEEQRVKAVDEAKIYHLNDDAVEAAKRWTNAVKARGEQVAEAEKAVAAATREHEAAKRDRAAVVAAIEKAVMGSR